MKVMEKKHREKYKNAVLYFANNLNLYQLGSTKLAKLLYYLDFISYRDRKCSVTGTFYYKQNFGPLAKDLVEIVGELVEENKLEVKTREIPDGRETTDYNALKSSNESVFDQYETMLLRKLVNKYGDWKTEQIVAKSHLEAPWAKTEGGGQIDFKLSFDIDDFDVGAEEEYKREDEETIMAIESQFTK